MNARGLAISSGVSGVGTSNNGGAKFLRSIANKRVKDVGFFHDFSG